MTEHAHPHAATHEHDHPRGFRGFLHEVFVPHTHDVADSIDDAAQASSAGIRAVKVSLVIMLATTLAQAAIVAVSGSIALFADTVHNLSDALTAVPLWIAFVLTRRRPTRTYPNGLGRAEDLAGLAIVATIALSAVVAAWQAIDRLIEPRPIDHLGWVMAAGVVGFLGNEAVAIYRIRVGRRIGSAALVADGVHARTDGFTSLAVVLGGLGVMLGFPIADPIIGLLIAALIVALLVGTLRSVGRRLLDGVDPELTRRAEEALSHVPEIDRVDRLRLRWCGHRLLGDAVVACAGRTAADLDHVRAESQREAREHLPHLDTFVVEVTSSATPPQPAEASRT